MKEIPLTQGKVAWVSDEDFERVSQFKWTAHKGSSNGSRWYAVRNPNRGGWIRLHRFIMGLPSGGETDLVVDHLNGDGLDNRRENLEVVPRAENYRRSQARRKAAIEPFL